MSGNPFKHPMQTIINIFVGIIAFVVVFNLLAAAVEPYLPMVGRIVAIVLVAIVAISGAVAMGALLVRVGFWDWLRDKLSRRGGTWNS